MFPEDKGDQISLKDIGLLTLTKLVFTTSTPFVGGFSLSYEADKSTLQRNNLKSIYHEEEKE